jgi:hypothetical protein
MSAGREEVPKEVADSGLAAYASWQFDQTLCWKDVGWLCAKAKISSLPCGCAVVRLLTRYRERSSDRSQSHFF